MNSRYGSSHTDELRIPCHASSTPHSSSTVDAECRSSNVSIQFGISGLELMVRARHIGAAVERSGIRLQSIRPVAKPSVA